ncbi:MAG: dockerin type I repeat-containing protein [Clostridia bacterium]|nr:dockerin type I repeat-containing protein [Clostridia bacterium]
MKTTKKIVAVLLSAIILCGCALNAAALYSPYNATDGKIVDILRVVMDAVDEDEKIYIDCIWPTEILDVRQLENDNDALAAAERAKTEKEIPAILDALPMKSEYTLGSDELQINLMWTGNYYGIYDHYFIRTYATKSQIEQLAALDEISMIIYRGYDVRYSRFGKIDEYLAAAMRFSTTDEKLDIIIGPLYDEEFDDSAWQALMVKSEAQKYGEDEIDAMIAAKREALREYTERNNQKFFDSLPQEISDALEIVYIAQYGGWIEAKTDKATVERLAQLDNVEAVCYNTPVDTVGEDMEIDIKDGDINGDGRVNAADARTALRSAAQLDELTRVQTYLGDMNASGKVDSADARTILRIAAKLEPNT